MTDKLKSRKLWVLMIGMLLQFINAQLKQPMTDDQMMQISIIIVGYLAAQGWVDGKEKKTNE